MRNCAGIERYKGLNLLDAGAGNRTSMDGFGCNKEIMEEYAEERGGKSD
jgi:hypothetical protein